MKRKTKTENPWDVARKRILERYYFIDKKEVPLDPGVNYFVEKLESLGAQPLASCEGHPQGFYVMFESSYALARRIGKVGYFSIEIAGYRRWVMRLNFLSGKTEKMKSTALRWAAKAWEKKLK